MWLCECCWLLNEWTAISNLLASQNDIHLFNTKFTNRLKDVKFINNFYCFFFVRVYRYCLSLLFSCIIIFDDLHAYAFGTLLAWLAGRYSWYSKDGTVRLLRILRILPFSYKCHCGSSMCRVTNMKITLEEVSHFSRLYCSTRPNKTVGEKHHIRFIENLVSSFFLS